MAGTSNSKKLAEYTVQYDLCGIDDPTVVPTEAAPGTTYRLLRNGFPKFFQKVDEGTTTNWLQLLTGISGINLGTGAQVLKNVVANQMQFRTIKAGTGVSVTQAANEIVISFAGSSELELPCNPAVAIGDLVVLSGGLITSVSSNSNAVIPYGIAGVCSGRPSGATANVLVSGKITGLSGLTTDAPVFVTATGGFGACPASGNVQLLGFALSATDVLFSPKQPFRRV